MAASPWVWEEDGLMEIQTLPVSLTYCSNLNCIILSRTDNSIDIIDVNSGDIVRETFVLDENNRTSVQCIFNPVAGNLVVTNGTCVGLRKDLNGIYLLKTALQTPVESTRDGEIFIEMTLPDMEHVLSGLQACMKGAHEPHLSKMERLNNKINESIEKVKSKINEGDEKLQKWASCHVKVEADLIYSTLNHIVSLLHSSGKKNTPLSATSALLSQVTSLLPTSSTDQNDTVSIKRKMWTEVNRRKTFSNWPHKDYKWAVPDTMAQAGFYHQSDRRTYPNSVDRAVCFTCSVGLVCWEPTDEPWSEHERHSPKCPFVRGECTENVPLSVTIATSPAQFHNKEKQAISFVSAPTSVPLLATSTTDGQITVWDIRDELQVRTRVRLKLDDKVLSNDVGELDDLLTADVMSDVIEESTKEALDVDGGLGTSGKASGSSSGEPVKSTAAECEPQSSEDPTGISIQMTSVGVLRNNQERENEAETPVIQTVLPEAMLVACASASPDIHLQPARPHLLLCEIPADKNRSTVPSKLQKSSESKGKSKSVSYSTQLSFESEDEYYDPLFSVPSVFQSMNNPLKDVFPKSGSDKTNETVKDAKVVQCLSLENVGCENLEVDQVIPYEDGSHVLFVLIQKKESFVQGVCTVNSHCSNKGSLSKTVADNAENFGTILDNDRDNKGSENEPEAANGTSNEAKENDEDNELGSHYKPDESSIKETNSTNNTKYPEEIGEKIGANDLVGSSEHVAEEDESSDNTKYHEETSNSARSSVSADADGFSNTSDNTKTPNINKETVESLETQPKSDTDPTHENFKVSESKVSPTENDGKKMRERNYAVCLLLYKTKREKGRTLLEDKPCKTLFTRSPQDSLHDVFLLPDDAEDSFMANSVEINITKSVYLAGITADGSLAVLDGLTLKTVTRFSPLSSKTGRNIHRAIFCSGLGSFCMCTENGQLHFLHLVKKNESTEDVTAASAGQASGGEKQAIAPTSSIPLEDLSSLKTLKSLVEMTTFENLVPRYTALVPIFWSEIQQEQQQRRHPQHLLQNSQGVSSCHTRTWRLQKKGVVGGDQLFKLVLPRPCYVGHVDITFTINKSSSSKSNLQVTLSKPRSSSLRPKPAHAFTRSGVQPTNDDVICGPVDLTKNLMPHGDKGHVVLTSASLLKTKVRSLHVVFESEAKTPGKGDENSGGRNGFSDLEEISITVRSLNAQFNAELFGGLLESPSFCPRLIDIVCEEPSNEVSGQEREDLQWFALELLCWIAGISVHQPNRNDTQSLANQVVEKLPMLIQSCFLSSSRSIAHKCSRLVVLCLSRISSSEHSSEAKSKILNAFLELLPSVLSSESSGGIHWFFTLLTGMMTSEDVDNAGRSCMELLMNIAQRLDSKLTYQDRVLRASFSLYGTPLDPTIFDISMETTGLFSTSILNEDLLKRKKKQSQCVDDIDLMDYIVAKNSSRTPATSCKMEQLLSSMYGVLEVEPLDFLCSSMSDGCKIDYYHGSGPQGGGGNGMGSLYYPSTGADNSTPMSALQDHVQQLKEHEKLLSKLQKQKQQLEEQHQELEELGGFYSPLNATPKHNLYEEAWVKGVPLPHQYKFPPSFGAMKTGGLFGGKAPSQPASMKTNTNPVPQTRTSFQLPVPKFLSIEKLQTGARHFVVLDFGQSVRLTDIFIPTCPNLSSLVIDIWEDSEEKDLSRVTVSTDIGSKPLLLTDLLPPLTCRYLKISIFARHGTLRTKLILGEYFGYPVLSESAVTKAEMKENEDAPREAYLNLMYDDVFCQYGIACSRLESVLNSIEPGMLTSAGNEKSRKDESKVKQAYDVCMSLQLRLNFLEQSIQRLQRRHSGNSRFPPLRVGENIDAVIEHASYSKLKVISDWLVHVLISLFGVEAPADSARMQWTQGITFETCQSLFTTFCVKGSSVSRARMGAVLLRTCGEQSWWGEFLAWVMERFFSLEQTLMFSQERLFLLLTSMSQLSLVQYPVISSALSLLEKLLSPILDLTQQDKDLHSHALDSRLLEWVTLFVSNLLDNFMDRSQDACSKSKDNPGNDSNDAKTENEHQTPSRRWDFIVPRTANDALNDSLKDSCKGLKGPKKETRQLRKQLAKQRKLYALHQHVANKMLSYDDYGPSTNAPSPFQIIQGSKQLRHKTKKPLKELKRLKRLITNNPTEPAMDVPYPGRNQKLPRHLCLPVMKGLLTVLLSSQGACSVDFFVLMCKVLGCLALVSQPQVSLNELASNEQLEQLLKMCVKAEGVPSSNWSSGDQWIRHACTTLVRDLVSANVVLRPSPVVKPPPPKPESEPPETPEVTETPTTASEISIGDIPEANEPGDETFVEFGMFHDLFGDSSPGSDVPEPKISEHTDYHVSEIIVSKSKSIKSKDTKEPPVVYSTVVVPALNTAEISTAEDCRLEISFEMKAEQELRSLAFTSRQRFLAGMDLKSGVEYPSVTVASYGGSGVESSVGESSGDQNSNGQSSGGQSSVGESSGHQNSKNENSGGQSSGVENSVDQLQNSDTPCSDNEKSERYNAKICHVVSECIGKLIVYSFKGFYDVQSVMELCLLLNDENSQSFFVTKQAMEASLEGFSSVEGESTRYWNLVVNWLRMLIRQTQYVSVSDESYSDYVTATNLVEHSQFPRVLGKMLTTCDMGDSGQKLLGPSLVKNFQSLLNDLASTSDNHEVYSQRFIEVLLDTVLYMTVHSESQLDTSRSYPLDVCMAFLEFLTQHFPRNTPFSELSKPVKVVDSILTLILSHLSSSNEICCVANTSKKRFTALFPTSGSFQESSNDLSREKFLLLCLTFLSKLFPLNAGQSKLSDNLVDEKTAMQKLFECLNMCRGESFELLEIGVNMISDDLSEVQGVEKPTSIEDGVMKIFCLVYKHSQQREKIMRSLLTFFSNDIHGGKAQHNSYYHISELLLWILLKLLDCDVNFQIFCENGGIEVICGKLSRATSRALHPVRGVVSTVVHQLGVRIHSKIEGEKHLLAAALESDKPLVNFAPYGTIHCPSHSASSVADHLISTTVPTRRARSAAWIHHFDHKDTWCPLHINLPNTVLVHEVVIQPHAASLSNSTSYVVIELSDESLSVTKVSPPLLTAGLSNIRLQLTTPQLASIVRLRFHRPRDSDTLGLNRIEILGTSFYGPLPVIQPVLHSQKASLSWSRALDYCLRRSHSLSSLVLETLSTTEGILDVLLKILWTFPTSNLKSCVEFILIKFASGSSRICTRLLNHLLYGGADLAGSLGASHNGNSENELLYQLGVIQDDQAWERLKPMCEWLLFVEDQTNVAESGKASNNLIPKIRTTAAVIWLTKDDPVLCEQLQALITEEKFRCIYEWSQRVLDIPMLKLTLDHLICALCYVIGPYFRFLLNLIGPSIKQSESKTDYSALTTLARASNSSLRASDLLESKILQKVVENVEKLCRKIMKGSKKISSSTELSEKSSQDSLETLEKMLEFLTFCLGHHQLKDWLGSEEGSSFWQSLLTFLTDCYSRVPARDSTHFITRDSSRVSVNPRVLASLQTTSLRFFKTCVSGHVRNQQNLARVLHELLARASDDIVPKSLSGFLRRLVLELLLDDDHVTVAVTCSNVTSQSVLTSPGNASQSPLWHPRFGSSNCCKLVSVRVNTKVQEILNTSVVNPLQQLQSLSSGVNATAGKTSETMQDLADLLEFGELSKHEAFTLTSSAFNVKHKRCNHGDKKKEQGTSTESTGVSNPTPEVKHPIENWLCCKDGPLAGIPLPKETTVAQIIQTVVEHGQSMGTICLRLDIRSPVDRNTIIPSDKSCVMTSQKSVSTLLEVFSELGGLALIANHLPPRLSLEMSSESARSVPSVYNPVVVTSVVPGHSLMGFTLFLRLPGYAAILLENQQNACYMLKLILGVNDNSDGAYNPVLASTQPLPTLPFSILQRLLMSHPISTTTGAGIRHTALNIGVVHLLLTCLGLLSHHKPRRTDPRQEATMEALKAFNTNNELGEAQSSGRTSSKQYWAKGTGFGTGSTSSGWDIEQALVKQKNEEEHITSILQVLASFICPLGVKIDEEATIDDISLDISDEHITNVLPSLSDIFMNSCLIPTLASYLRNDSVLDMARHVPLYRAVLGFVRCIAVSPNLVPLLHPGQQNIKNTSKDESSSLCSLLTKMKLCVDTYGSRLRSSEKVDDSKKKFKVEASPSSASGNAKTEDVENESLSLLIPDVQTTSMLVHKAVDRYRWEHLNVDGSSADGEGHGQGAGEELMSTEERYSSVMMPLQFDTFSIVTEGVDGKVNFTIPYHFSSSVKSATSSGQRTNAGRARRLAQEIASLSTSLPLSYSSSVFVRCDEERLDIMKVLMTGPADTPYANGCFEFDVYFPPDYPSNPMHISFETTGNHRIRFNPNLYNDGKVCLSILNTWHGRPEEKWNSQTSSFLQVLVSIQSLILVPEPYFNEPGYERSRGTHSGTVNSREYDANIRQATVKWAMLEPLKNPCPCFKQVIERHFFLKKDEVLGQCDEWIKELESWSKEKRTMRSISHHLESLRRHTTQLRDEIAKLSEDCLKTPDDDTE